jgi:outer membrane biosynthesis protein TonB
MRRSWTYAVLALTLLAGLSGCKKKKPVLPPPQTQAPDISRLPQPEQPEPLPPPEASAGKATPVKPAPKPAPKRKIVRKPAPPRPEKKLPPAQTEPSGQLSAGLTPGETSSQRRSAAQLLDATDSNLRSLRRALNNDEQSMVQQIRSYMAQSRTAQSDGDTDRAYNLALKANLLSQELVKR